eukprot:CAMPEP_0172935424 /NCGR_PEP_ID=MMETSP1075-20121228/221508_1 /TAXON_ID=2916 /ORGANISM="Ceratium fusus, Strain PA161109" /LENGTH=195 /DNA_ID=CAMNT_0013796783 /DNA_START=229 /DNA_END=816 /DNA_ORIENTATION=+
MYTLTLVISGGLPWQDLLRPLETFSMWFRPFFVLFVGCVQFGVLNILAAVFVSFVGRHVNSHHEERLQDEFLKDSATVENLRHQLATSNPRDDGKISKRRLEKLLKTTCQHYLTSLDLELEAALDMFKMLDTDDTDTGSIDEFVCGLLQLKGNPDNIHVATMMYENKRIMLRISRLTKIVETNFTRLLTQEGELP